MNISISSNAVELGQKAAKFVSARLIKAIEKNNEARLLVSTGSSQFDTFQSLVKEDLPWSKIEVFHLDEYIGLPMTHPASFRKYLYERFINLVPVKKFHSVDVEGDIALSINNLTMEIKKKQIDVGLIGIGVNGHIAFNDPPADFTTKESYIIVSLDNQCKMQQVNEGWFKTINDVPKEAISMSVWQIMQCKTIVSCVPHGVKANAIYETLKEKINNMVPATMLKQHDDFNLFLDFNSASKLITF